MAVTDSGCHELYSLALRSSSRVLAFGPPGVGKTHAAVYSAIERGEEYVKMTCTDGDMAAEYRGMFIPAGDHFEFMLGLATSAWVELNDGEGGLLVLDEIDHAPPEVHSLLHAILDDPAIAALTLPNGKQIKPGPKFRVVGTMNGVPADLSQALRDRFAAKVRVDRPSQAALQTLPEDLREKAEALMLSVDETMRVSFRELRAFADFRQRVNEDVAAQLAFDSNRWNDVLTAIRLS